MKLLFYILAFVSLLVLATAYLSSPINSYRAPDMMVKIKKQDDVLRGQDAA